LERTDVIPKMFERGAFVRGPFGEFGLVADAREVGVFFPVHPGEARAEVEKGGHADSTWSCVKKLQTRRSACPPVCCITRFAFEATSTHAPSTAMARSYSPLSRSLKATVVQHAVRLRSALEATSTAAS